MISGLVGLPTYTGTAILQIIREPLSWNRSGMVLDEFLSAGGTNLKRQHPLERFNQLADSIEKGRPDGVLATQLWEKDRLFEDIDYRWWGS